MKYYAAQRGNLVERYLMEVGRKLPEKLRADVKLELRSALQDTLEERGLDAEKAQDQQKIAEVLKEYGKPSLVAESYGARNYLIGPELLPTYWLVLRIGAIVIGTVQVISLVLAATNQSDLSAVFQGAASTLFDSLLDGFAIITIIFFLVDKAIADVKLPHKEWDPLTLPELTLDRDRVDRAEVMFETIFLGVFIVAINSVSGIAAPAGPIGENWDVVAALVEEFGGYFPILIALGIVEIGLKFILIARGRWERWTRIGGLGIDLANIAVTVSMLSLAPFTALPLVDTIIKIIIAIALTVTSIEAAGKLYRLLFPDRPSPWQTVTAELKNLSRT